MTEIITIALWASIAGFWAGCAFGWREVEKRTKNAVETSEWLAQACKDLRAHRKFTGPGVTMTHHSQVGVGGDKFHIVISRVDA